MYQHTTTNPLVQTTGELALALTPRRADADPAKYAQLEQSALEAQRLATLGALAVGIAREFNSLLAAITASAALARMGSPQALAWSRALKAIEEAARLCLQLARYGSNEPFPIQKHLGWPKGNPSNTSSDTAPTVLLADDEELIRKAVSRMLELSGLKMIHAADGREAVELFRQHRDKIHVVLLDASMPKMTGAEALLEIRRLSPTMPVILMSGYCECDAIKGSGKDPLVRFLQKPFAPEGLRQMLAAILRLAPQAAAGT